MEEQPYQQLKCKWEYKQVALNTIDQAHKFTNNDKKMEGLFNTKKAKDSKRSRRSEHTAEKFKASSRNKRIK